MDNFSEEIKSYSTEDIQLILSDQADLYSDEEIDALRKELESRTSSSEEFNKEKYIASVINSEFELQREQEEKAITEARIKQMKLVQQQQEYAQQQMLAVKNAKIESLRKSGAEGYWEYKVLSIFDENGGFVSFDKLADNMNELGLQGWKLRCAYSNEIGHNSSSAGAFGLSAGTNATIDQNVLIFERFIKIKSF